MADAAAKIRLGEADVMIAAGTESMSAMPQMMGNKVSLNPAVFAKEENVAIAYGMVSMCIGTGMGAAGVFEVL